TASPIEALFGRGRSGTSSVLTLVIGVLTVVLLGALTDSWVVAIIAAVALAVAALAINPRVGPQQQPLAARLPEAPVTAVPAAPPPSPHVPPPGSYQPPFAPHGPYTAPPAPVPPKKTKPKPEPSRLGRLIFGVILIALGSLGLADMAGVSVPAAAYVATALGVVGLGLLVGAWYGRARVFILLGLALAVLLPMVATADKVERANAGSVSWRPSTMNELASVYSHQFGEARLDLSDLDFQGTRMEIKADISFGDLRIIVPPNVDTTVVTNVSFGDAEVFHRSSNGAGLEQQQTDVGEDGAGGGELLIILDVKFAHAEVSR
ncbi:LiaF domain-containing protein, partial [Allorhizocola rhizosphaerae]|uniref:LiaF domain-containing protein n=1 Tax=Allorhizocola rhizosphaerae TaxID=1872709 RepID=UPI0013C36D69